MELNSVPSDHRNRLLRPTGRALGPFLELRREISHALAHHFAGFEFHRGPRRNGKCAAGQVRVATDPRLREAHFEHAKITELDGVSFGECIGDMIERSLDDIEHLRLDKPSLVGDLDNQITLG